MEPIKLSELRAGLEAPHGTPPRRLTDAELTAQHAGYHDFNAVESMVCEIRERRRADLLLEAAPMLLDLAESAKDLQHEGWDFRSPTMDRVISALRRIAP